MINQPLMDFINSQLKLGLTKEKISSDLLANGWTEQDIEEGFKAALTPAPVLFYAPISTSYINTNTSSPVQIKSRSNAKLFLTILILFLLLGGGASAFYFRNDLIKLPILKDIFPNKNVIVNTEVPASDTNQIQNLPTAPIMVDGVLDCGSDVNCFIAAANDCQKSKLNVVIKDKEMQKQGTKSTNTDFLINGKEKNDCVARIKVLTYVFRSSPEAIDLSLSMGRTKTDIEKIDNDFSKSMISDQVCRLDLSKKMGDVLNKNLISGDDSLAMYTPPSSSFYSGLNCGQFVSLNSDLNKNNEIIGVDTDKDGVWDYIQNWIDKNYSSNINVRKSLRLLAKEQQLNLINANNKELIIKQAKEPVGVYCLLEADAKNGDEILKEFQSAMFNNMARIKAKLTSDSQLNGQVIGFENSETIKRCGF